MKDILKIHKARETTRLFWNVGPYYIVDHYTNTVVDTKLPTLQAAKDSLRRLRATQG